MPRFSFLKNLIGRAYLALPGGALRRHGVVLGLHRVVLSDAEAAWPHCRALCMGRQAFERLLRWLGRHFECVPLESLLECPGGKRPRMALTFDDGWRDNAELAFPLLQRYEFPASFFLSTDFIGGDGGHPPRCFWWEAIGKVFWQTPQSAAAYRVCDALRACGEPVPPLLLCPEASERRSWALVRYLRGLSKLSPEKLDAVAALAPALSCPITLDWAQVRALEDSGLARFGPHGASHAILTRLDAVALERELARSHAALRAHCRHPLPVYCYPNGDHDDKVRSAVAALGYRHALTARLGLIGPGSDPLTLPRINVSHGGSGLLAQISWHLLRSAWA
ncbi:MAG: polysaccharide deacetylase family protein [Zoogloeaceae bacterium]|jgi:peptidoglycan/xylan/chitin deacetylase (PgdA/CDA1 family)|nr:polysaccharide deacetylase family protein [Zoogloeaceae bacterium]